MLNVSCFFSFLLFFLLFFSSLFLKSVKALQEAQNWKSLSADMEIVLTSGNSQVAADKLQEMERSLIVLKVCLLCLLCLLAPTLNPQTSITRIMPFSESPRV